MGKGEEEPRRGRRSVLKALGLGALGSLGLGRRGLPLSAFSRAEEPSGAFPFELVPAAQSGIAWVHHNGRSSEYYLPETTGAGCAFLDYDNDGWMDIYLVNSGNCDFFHPNPPLRNALYHNNRDGTFTDVAEKAGVAGGGYGQGVAVGDYDGDGWPDIYLTQYGGSTLYRNNHDGTFTDVTNQAGVRAPGWASSAVWFDYDNDGRLDLFVCRFVDFDKSKNKFCGNHETGERYYCIPRVYDPTPSWLFHNNGDGTFTDVSKDSGIANVQGKAWGVVATDINNDGRMDLFVANDTVANFLFANRGNGKFEEIALQADVGYSADGRARSGMGVDSADYDQDGWLDLFVDNVDQEMYSTYHNNHDETFDDVSIPNGIGMATRLMSGWGVKFLDYDNDGNLDLFIANGHPDDKIEERFSEVKYQEPLLLFRNTGGGFQHAFQNVSTRGGPLFEQRFASRGLAVGDFNNDGGMDILVAVNNGAPLLMRNNVGKLNHWLGIRLVGTVANRDAMGATITWQAGDLKRAIFKVGGGSYLASHDPRVVLGIGQRAKIDWVEIKWPQPSGKTERFTSLPIDRYIKIVEGKGIVT
ncbi:MAG TPA: CRTAC1 family protein [Terriglobia bacterium]|nr:CRTAC1 family protein [Terriglobia bacterium]